MDTSGMGLAPPFTRENAGDYARKATIAREANRKAKQIAYIESHARPAIEPEINRVVRAMSKLSVTSDEYLKLSGILDRLWNKAFNTQGAVKSRGNRDRSPSPMPEPEATKPESIG